MSEKKIIVTDYDYVDIELERKLVEAQGFRFGAGHAVTEDQAIEIARDADGLLNQYVRITRKVTEALPNCRVICRYGIGFDNIDLGAATDAGIVVCNVPDYCLEEVSNHSVALIMALDRRIVAGTDEIRRGTWDYSVLKPVPAAERQIVGIVGMGNIGRRVARKMGAMGYGCIAYDPFVPGEVFREWGAAKVELDDLLSRADIVSINSALTPENRHLIGRRELELMKPTAFLVNTARGGLIDQNALTEALQAKRIRGAGLDVLEQEPPAKEDLLLSLDNVIFTPHLSYYSEQAIERLRTGAVEAVMAVLRGKMPKSVVNPAVLKKVKLDQ